MLSVERSRVFGWLVRAGFLARALTYALIGALALALALGVGTAGTAANQQGAVALIASAPLGRLALVLIAAGLLAYALWKLTQGVLGRGPEGGGGPSLFDRSANIGGGLLYLAFFAVAVRALAGDGSNDSGAPRHATAGVLGWPGGPVLVGAAGAVLIAISAYQIYDPLSGRFAKQAKTGGMSSPERDAFLLIGRIGLTARACVFALVGYFLLKAAIAFDPGSAVGVDGALARLRHQDLGPLLLGIAAGGLIVFAVFSVMESRYRRL
jgi:uncharacterized protein DUF1206